jgi:hypothetical protein
VSPLALEERWEHAQKSLEGPVLTAYTLKGKGGKF